MSRKINTPCTCCDSRVNTIQFLKFQFKIRTMEASESIEVYQDVSFDYTPNDSNELRNQLCARTFPPWHLAKEWEEEVTSRTDNETEVIAFGRDELGEICPSYLCLFNSGNSKWTIPNVVPKEFQNRLTMVQYNDVLEDFTKYILTPTLNSLHINPTISPRRLNLYSVISEKSARAFNTLISNGIVSGMILHPCDEQRLCDFIWTLHEHDCDFDVTILLRWLREAERWPEDYAESLAKRIDQGLKLLNSRS